MKSVCLSILPLSSSRFHSWRETAANISQDGRGTWTPFAFAPGEGRSGTDSLICFVRCLLLFPNWLLGTDRSVSLTIIRDARRQEVTVSDISFCVSYRVQNDVILSTPITNPLWCSRPCVKCCNGRDRQCVPVSHSASIPSNGSVCTWRSVSGNKCSAFSALRGNAPWGEGG